MLDLEEQGKVPFANLSKSQQLAMDKIIQAYMRKADTCDASAQLNLGFMCHEGKGVNQDCKEAFRW